MQLLALDQSKLRGIVNTRRLMLNELGWEPEWEVNPKELQLVEKIGKRDVCRIYACVVRVGDRGARQPHTVASTR